MKQSALTLMKDLASLLFFGQKLILNDPLDQPQDFDDTLRSNKESTFLETILEEAQRYNDAAETVMNHF